jgi:hypothetical protein
MDWSDKIERKEFLDLLSGLCYTLGKESNEHLIKTYHTALNRFDISIVKNVINKAVVSFKWFPKPVELIELIEGSSVDNSEIQAAQAFEAIRRVGPYQSVVFDDPVTQEVIKQYYGGWPKFCEGDSKDIVFKMNDFKKAYKAFSNQNRKHYGSLYGISSISNDSNGIKQISSVKMIGNPEKCKQILEKKSQNVPLISQNVKMDNVLKKIADNTKI